MISSAKDFADLISSEDIQEQKRITHDEASESTWFEILETYPEYTIWVIRNKTIPISILRHLSTHSDVRIRWEVALKRKLDMQLFEYLSDDLDEDVRKRIALNRKVPQHILEKLARDQSSRVAEVARKRLEGKD